FNGEYFVGLGDTQEKAFEAYLKKVSGVAPTATTADDNYVELVKSDRIDIIKLIFAENDITISEPTSIQIPLSFNEGEIIFFTESDRADIEDFLSKFIDDFVKPRSERVFMWQEENHLNIGTIYVKNAIPEMHYVSIEVGN
ncbi:MAG: hypothetical protein HKP31_07755, partial [Nitrosopumilus sp.]|nr:hypothetical protein [Nitrosopumilus sp.]